MSLWQRICELRICLNGKKLREVWKTSDWAEGWYSFRKGELWIKIRELTLFRKSKYKKTIILG